MSYVIPRRSFLRGAGVCMALPALEIMSPAMTRAHTAESTEIPLRLGVFHKGNGIGPEGWEATGSEAEFTLPRI